MLLLRALRYVCVVVYKFLQAAPPARVVLLIDRINYAEIHYSFSMDDVTSYKRVKSAPFINGKCEILGDKWPKYDKTSYEKLLTKTHFHTV